MNGLSLLLFEATVVYALVLVAHAARWRLTLGPFFAVIGWITATMWWVSAVGGVVRFEGLVFTVGSIVFYTGLILAVFIVYVFDGPAATRTAAGIVVAISFAVPGTFALFSAQLPGIGETLGPLADTFTLRGVIGSVTASLVGFAVLAIGWELVNRGSRRLPLALRVFAVIAAALLADNAVYMTLTRFDRENFATLLATGLASRLVLSLLVFPLAWAYLRYTRGGREAVLQQRPLLAIARSEGSLDRQLLAHFGGGRGGEPVLRAEREMLQRILDHIPLLVTLHGRDGRLSWANRAFETVVGRGIDELGNASTDTFASLFQDEAGNERFDRFLRSGTRQWREFHVRRPGGDTVAVLFTTVPISEGLVIGLGQDLTEREQMAQELSHSRDQLRELALHLQSVAEEERTALSRTLHDELGQTLVSLQLDLAALRVTASNDGRLAQFASMAVALQDALGTVRRISADLRPPLLDSFGFASAVKLYVDNLQARTALECKLEVPPDFVPPNDQEATALFRVLQESLVNVVRHSGATRVQIRLYCDSSRFGISITDDGRGIDSKDLGKTNSFGIRGMRERVRALGGSFVLGGPRGGGTSVEVELPRRTCGFG